MKRALFNKTRTITSLVVLLMTLPVWGNDGDTFTEMTVEGVKLTYTIISEAEKTCMVGEKYSWEVPTARASRVHKVSGSQLSGDITIPEVANGYAVIYIEAFAFERAAITSVVIPNSVKALGIGAFAGCADLKSVRLSNQLTKIEAETFLNCANLTSIDIPEGVTSIGDDAFYGCRQLKEAIIPSSLVHFGKYVFCSTGFTSMPKLPEGLTTIPYGIFQSCPLTSVEIPQNITTIDGCAFNNCLFTEIEIPASVTHIGVAALSRCKNLSSIVIPNNVTDIDFNAFKECSNLKTVTLSNNLNSLSEGIFSDCTSLESVVIPSGVKIIGKLAFGGCSSLSSISLPETMVEIGNQAFYACSSLTQLYIPQNVVSIKTEEYSPLLNGCNSLTSIIVDEDNPVYDSRNNCNAIIETASNKIIAGCTKTTIPEGITTIGSYAFYCLQNLTSVSLPQSLNRIEGGAFHTLGLKEIIIPENVTFIGSYSFCNCKQLKSVKSYIKEPFEIPEKAFYGSTTDATLYVPKGTVDKYKATKGWNVFSSIIENTEPQMADVMIDETTFPDSIFRNWVLSQEYGKDGILTEEEIAEVTFMNLFPQNIIAEGHIKSLKGIEYFTAVTKLVCSRNELTELDLSKNTALTWLECYGNNLTELDLSKNTELTNLDCNANELIALDVSCCNKLTELNCNNNKLTTLNASGCSALTILKCYANQLTIIDLSGCTSLATMWAFGNQLSALNVSDCTALSTLWCYNNQLTQLDVSKNTELTILQCSNNQLTQLDVSKNTELKELRCENNQLTALDLSNNKMLTSLRTYHNPIKGEAMDALIESLPTVSRGGWCCVLSEDEEGVVNTTQVAIAKAKGWTTLYWNEAAKNWMEYVGFETVQNNSILCDGRYSTAYDLQGRRLNSLPTKGIYIRDGRKVVVR